ncbi:AmmeMemoRadiSam system radical SAM enzyme [uncultured Bacteroides sp.]|uniref:AmmeMemoRadiSam system radical SAM enzyme n=1 Tax=uncultured Bacteroides sp. TaxID=162156 RepID=UPI002AAAD619|nr:AmmeMemoRadiSam system radical SAM enzyme [uncultured Bacteroides sp.]
MGTINLGKWHKLSAYQEKMEGNKVRCHICPHNCLVNEGGIGICKTRVNKRGVLYSLAYGNPCSIGIDPIEKKPLFHFLPGERIYSLATAGCNFRCLNCQNWQISQSSPNELDHYDLPPEEVVKSAIAHNTQLIAFTYTEPTVFYEYVYDTAQIAHEEGLRTVFISNGFINKQPLLDLCPYLDAANIDLKCFDDAIYRELDGGRLQPVLDTLKTMKEKGVWLEITNLLVPGYTDNPKMIEAMCNWLIENGFSDTPLHFSRFFPAYKLANMPPTQESILIEAKNIAEKAGIKYVYVGNIPSLHDENTYCSHCKRMIIERNGFNVERNHIQEGKCEFCKEPIAGVWE